MTGDPQNEPAEAPKKEEQEKEKPAEGAKAAE